MVKHIVLFRLSDSLSATEKAQIAEQFKQTIEALPNVIPFIRHIYVGTNINTDEKWDICLDSSFDSLDDVRRYAVHPEHVAAAAIIKDAKVDRSCVDFEIPDCTCSQPVK